MEEKIFPIIRMIRRFRIFMELLQIHLIQKMEKTGMKTASGRHQIILTSLQQRFRRRIIQMERSTFRLRIRTHHLWKRIRWPLRSAVILQWQMAWQRILSGQASSQPAAVSFRLLPWSLRRVRQSLICSAVSGILISSRWNTAELTAASILRV